MTGNIQPIEQFDRLRNMADILTAIEMMDLSPNKRRDMSSAINRLCWMAGHAPCDMTVEVAELRTRIAGILPAAHNISAKTFSNIRSLVQAALEAVGILDSRRRGFAVNDDDWAPIMAMIKPDRRLSLGLATFANWCAVSNIPPQHVDDTVLQNFLTWLETRTIIPKPGDVARQVSKVWNEAHDCIDGWPDIRLTPLSFRKVSDRLSWEDVDERFRRDAEAYLAMRANPDIFDERPGAPRRPLAATTLRQQREHIRLAASVLVQTGVAISDITSLTHLIDPEAMKTVLRHYLRRADGKPNAFAVALGKTIIQIAQYHVGATAGQIAQLKAITAKLPSIPFDLTDKNKALLRRFTSEHDRAALLYLPQQLLNEVKANLDDPRLQFVKAQVGIAVDILLVAPLRPQNLSRLNWRRHFSEPNGPNGSLTLHIPAAETKTGKRELVFEIPDDVARRLRWYRRTVLPRLGADPDGDLFAGRSGRIKSQETMTQQIVELIEQRLGIHMTVHQFRHLAALLYLESRPEDFETVRCLLGHAFTKTTQIYAGASSLRASQAYGEFIIGKRQSLKLKRPRRRKSRTGA